jgi:hypothetical protein
MWEARRAEEPASKRIDCRQSKLRRSSPDPSTSREILHRLPILLLSEGYTLSFTWGKWTGVFDFLSFPGLGAPLYPIVDYPHRVLPTSALLSPR